MIPWDVYNARRSALLDVHLLLIHDEALTGATKVWIRERNYNADRLTDAYAALLRSRAATQALFAGLTDEQWKRGGIHPEVGPFSLTDAAFQVSLHDQTHTEQILKILTGRPA